MVKDIHKWRTQQSHSRLDFCTLSHTQTVTHNHTHTHSLSLLSLPLLFRLWFLSPVFSLSWYVHTASLLVVRTFFCLGCSPPWVLLYIRQRVGQVWLLLLSRYYGSSDMPVRSTSFSVLSLIEYSTYKYISEYQLRFSCTYASVSLHNSYHLSQAQSTYRCYKYRLGSTNLILPFGRTRHTYEVKKSPPSAPSLKTVWRAV